MKDKFKPILLGSDINVYGMASSFYDEWNVTSIAIGKGILGVCKNSKIVKVEIVEPNIEDDEIFVNTLISFKKNHKDERLLLVPCGDNYIKLLVRNQERLRNYYDFICNDLELFDTLCTKESFYDTCKKYDLPFPKTEICTKENYKKFKAPFDYPVIIKPSNSPMYWNCSFPNKKKVFLANSQDEMTAIFKAIYSSSYTDHLIVQEYIPGDDTADRVVNTYSDRNGKVKMVALGNILLEECTPEGIGSYAAIISNYDEEIVNLVTNFLEKIEYKGFANFDFKFDGRDGKYKVFEINPRQGRSSYYATAAGCNLSRYIVKDLILEEKMDKEVCKNKILYSIIPKKIIYKYVRDNDLKKEAKELIKNHKYYNSYMNKRDASLKRRISFIRNQLFYFHKYKKYFGDKSYHGEI